MKNSSKTFTKSVPTVSNRPTTPDLLTSTAAAKHLGVAVSTLKRWADDGLISHVRTRGGHRRFRYSDLEATQQDPEEHEITEWIALLLSDADAHTILGALRQLRGTSSSWREAGTRIAKVTSELGRRWAMGHSYDMRIK